MRLNRRRILMLDLLAEGMNETEIAKRIGCSADAVKVAVSDAARAFGVYRKNRSSDVLVAVAWSQPIFREGAIELFGIKAKHRDPKLFRLVRDAANPWLWARPWITEGMYA